MKLSLAVGVDFGLKILPHLSLLALAKEILRRCQKSDKISWIKMKKLYKIKKTSSLINKKLMILKNRRKKN
jgi:hypothetical protein